ncbi:hypothetical protein SmJEL517_g02668 [Synchytrium microbalum]|uniref:Methyltransferase domain-containing protein n=1 Tax=Synchytrium microbalum TaxID=1806994 RepID=A0A507CAT5_9FUNG|nr:uncharacterized protein SmJEL517_g02668 [Synchytrium microbalum]TPX34635.1 hypothetical protein SmJEL517_g02668 [Synchytrium microbalum]
MRQSSVWPAIGSAALALILFMMILQLGNSTTKILMPTATKISVVPEALDDLDDIVNHHVNKTNIVGGISKAQWSAINSYGRKLVLDAASTLSREDAATMKLEDIYGLFTESYDCDNNLYSRLGGESGDGGKWICGEYFKNSSDTVVVSVGSSGNFKFEDAVIAHSPDIKIHTFDCTGNWSHPPVVFEPWCLSGEDKVMGDGKIYKLWPSLLRDAGIPKVDLLKIDIEGYEWATIPHLLRNSTYEQLPRQISIELHLWKKFLDGSTVGVPADYLAFNLDQSYSAIAFDYLHPTISLFQDFFAAGYEIAAAEMNPESAPAACCSEYTFVLLPKSK